MADVTKEQLIANGNTLVAAAEAVTRGLAERSQSQASIAEQVTTLTTAIREQHLDVLAFVDRVVLVEVDQPVDPPFDQGGPQ